VKNTYKGLLKKVNEFDPVKYGYSRNYLDGGVSRLSPFISRGIISTKTIFDTVLKKDYDFEKVQKFLQELSWRDYWQKNGSKQEI
jgi:deoxyribodipyrimidine photo-lyase